MVWVKSKGPLHVCVYYTASEVINQVRSNIMIIIDSYFLISIDINTFVNKILNYNNYHKIHVVTKIILLFMNC